MIPIKDNIPTDRFPVVTVLLILANVIAYVASVAHGGSLISGPDTHEVLRFGAIPYALTHPGEQCGFVRGMTNEFGCTHHPALVSGLPWWETVFTSMFVHGSILHIAGNLLFLWIFGNNVEDAMGPLRFIAFYLLGGVAALALQTAIDPNSTAPTIGASGAIAAVLGGYIVLYPRARVLSLVFVLLFFTVIELPALVMLGIWFVQQAVFGAAGLTSTSTGGVAYFAHVGGFVFGLLTIRWLARRRKATPPTRVMAVS
ncbi:MAG TPA: rhomboid family intramembrane serine protease [Solirubrobacteraceae bacterium]|nr:rhomboid family intramembrane serine protease [Solirubrobacteraceae bacterium]